MSQQDIEEWGIQERARAVRMIAFDVDGVLTDGSLIYGDDGQEYKAFNSRDGHGIKMLRASGVETAIITGRSSQVVLLRARNLGIAHLFQGADDKLGAFEKLLASMNLAPEQIAYMGDDLVDLPVLRRCGLAISVPDAPDAVKARCHYVTHTGAGRGAAREACELILRAQGTWAAQLALYDR
ncbi:MAG: phenylphosphate carboxylase subunit delta [Hydrogenophilales bacterium CG17_big_fil_post_rev_8_21_14_2_50_63_12]|nr:MAG: phenylphosphate carboxylase subunit delta [Hydrogenophilales bacterium CG17_big_fil_post_rev_8_21_14_2_50_63_12]PIX98125.1 MAG: phenylphosphate carboxylase subunit delta [Hydrogenophilales bacterium CG_4_10_14_3_um_filter_63_21]PJB05594.1 MAG: phenylphosphate carboxylase subunit delta [Hydrogenophilales bacterium CG_4_9_14_3_um_filter_63_34]